MGLIYPRQFANLLSPKRQVPMGRLQIDWKHPLALDLIGCWVPGVMGGIDVAGKAPTLLPGSSQAYKMSPEGPGIYGAANSYLSAIATLPFKSWTKFTVYFRSYQVSSPDTHGPGYFYLTYNNLSGAMGNPYAIAGLGAKNATQWHVFWNTSAATLVESSGTSIVAGLQSLGATFMVGGNVIAYSSGAAVQSTNFGVDSAPAYSTTSTISLGGDIEQPTYANNQICTIGCAWNRVLSAAEMAWLDQDPYGFLLPS